VNKINLLIIGIDALYNRLWSRPSLASIRWLHLLVAFGAILSTSMLLPSTISTTNENLSTIVMTRMLFFKLKEIDNSVLILRFSSTTS